MKVALIHGKFFNSWEAQGLGLIAAYAKREVPDTEFVFFQGSLDSDQGILSGAADCDVAAFSCTSPTMPHALRLAQRLKALKPSMRVVFGGYHPSALPVETLTTGAVDQVVVGEGEKAMVEILRGCTSAIVEGQRMAFSALPWPDRELIRNERNIEVAFRETGQRITSFHAHRGCPFNCKFCADGATKPIWGKGCRERSPKDVVDEMEVVGIRYRLDLAKFSDGTWNSSQAWVDAFCREKIARGLRLAWFANIHAGLVGDAMFERMAEAGCVEVGMGIESGSERVLALSGKGLTVGNVRRAVRLAHLAKIRVRGYFVLGMPDETEADLERTEALAEELALDEYGFSMLCPYPGTAYYDPAKHADVDWGDEYGNDFWATEHVSNRGLHEWQARLRERFSDRMTLRQRTPDAVRSTSGA